VIAVVAGGVVWLVLAVALLAWLVVTTLAGPRRLPGIVDVARWLVTSWLGRFVLLALWAEAGWHVFGQRP
jgi:hypothetical protein